MIERRREARKSTQGHVRITIAGTGLRCAMRNLSPSGCMVECQDLIAAIGSEVEVALLPGYVASGEVAWQLGESIGILFSEPISPNIVQQYALDDWMLRSDWTLDKFRPPRS